MHRPPNIIQHHKWKALVGDKERKRRARRDEMKLIGCGRDGMWVCVGVLLVLALVLVLVRGLPLGHAEHDWLVSITYRNHM